MKYRRSFQERLAQLQVHWRLQAALEKARDDKARELARSKALAARKRTKLLIKQAALRAKLAAVAQAKKEAKARGGAAPKLTKAAGPSILSPATILKELRLAKIRQRYGVKHNILDIGPKTKRQYRFDTESWNHWLSQHPRNKPKYHDIWTVYWEDMHPRWLQSNRAIE